MDTQLPFNDIENADFEGIFGGEVYHPLPFQAKGARYEPVNTYDPFQHYSRHDQSPSYRMDINYNVMRIAIMKHQRQDTRKQWKLKNISHILKMPIELLVEIFEWLHPLDLYHIGMTCRSLRTFIYSQNSFWRTSCNTTGMPTCPPDWSYRQWANLLFGPTICNECGKYVGHPDFAFRRRICSVCLDKNYHQRWTTFTEPLMFTLTLGTRRHRGCHFQVNDFEVADDFGRRRIKDIKSLEEKLKELRSLAGGDQTLEAEIVAGYALQHQEDILLKMERARLAEQWAWDLFTGMGNRMNDEQMTRLNKIKARLLKREFVEEDFEEWDGLISEMWFEGHMKNQTRKVWVGLLPKFIEKAEQTRVKRLERERRELLQNREVALVENYAHYRHNRPSSEWWELPSTKALLQIPAMQDLINDPSKVLLKDEEWTAKLVERADEFAEWRRGKIEEIKSSIPEAVRNESASESASTPAALDRAVLVFTCTGCRSANAPHGHKRTGNALFGITEAQAHIRCDEDLTNGKIEYDERAGHAVRSLLELLEMREDVSVKGLDEVNARIICHACTQSKSKGVVGGYAMTWRECVVHALETKSKSDHDVFGWHLLTSEAKAFAMRRELPDGRILDNAWVCTLCNVHHTSPQARSDALRHAGVVHEKRPPVAGVDVVYYPSSTYSARKPLVVPAPPENIICTLCPESRRRFMDHEAMKKHFRDKHEIASENVNWDEQSQTIPIVERSTPGRTYVAREKPPKRGPLPPAVVEGEAGTTAEVVAGAPEPGAGAVVVVVVQADNADEATPAPAPPAATEQVLTAAEDGEVVTEEEAGTVRQGLTPSLDDSVNTDAPLLPPLPPSPIEPVDD